MTTMMDWEETAPSPAGSGSASGSSLNGHSETEDETIVKYQSAKNFVATLNLKLHNSRLVFGDRKLQLNSHYSLPAKENSLILNDGFNGLNLNPSPPVGQDLSINSSSSINFSLPLPRSPINSSPTSKLGSQPTSASQGSGGSDSGGGGPRKHKPIPPPLDLSIGASSLNSTPSSTIDSAIFQYSGTFYSPYYLGSPKFNQAEKSLPLRKRWHSWSPKLMNCNEDLIPLYSETPTGSSSGAASRSTKGGSEVHDGSKTNGSLQPPPYSLVGGRGGQGSSGNGNATPQSAGLQTPTPFYTPNEPSPRFMNSPVFSYSTPDTTLYQGPYSPIRTTTLYPPGSPFLSSNLNTPTFVITNLSPPSSTSTSTSSSNSAPTVGVGASSSGSTSSSSSTSSAPSIPAVTSTGPNISTASGHNSPFPTNRMSPNSQGSCQSYEESSQDNKFNNVPLMTAPHWNIFMAGTKVRFIGESGQTTGWYLADYLAQLTDLTLILGLTVKGEYAPQGLSVKQYVVTSSARERVQITFTPANNEQLQHPNIEADCEAGHPFIILKKGICAVKPEGFISVYGTPCNKLEVLDVCVQLNIGGGLGGKQGHYQNVQPPNLFMGSGMSANALSNGFRNGYGSSGGMNVINANPRPTTVPPHIFHQFEDMKPNFADLRHSYMGGGDVKPCVDDIKSFAHSLPPMSMPPPNHHSPLQHHHQLDVQIKREPYSNQMEMDPSPPIYEASPKKPKMKSKSKKLKESNNNGCSSPSNGGTGEPKGRRPMNAFLVYAKEKRPLLIQMYPGKDNRSISTLLGDSWKNLDPEQKNYYIKTAKDSADEQKKLHPDCWKRKRTQQQAQQQQSSAAFPLKMEPLTKVN